ncbi:MAG: hypothetical protein HY842_06515 [Bacteroidetes bacterium]|nr:hypothetical protein [Bacteroidota bacterium]
MNIQQRKLSLMSILHSKVEGRLSSDDLQEIVDDLASYSIDDGYRIARSEDKSFYFIQPQKSGGLSENQSWIDFDVQVIVTNGVMDPYWKSKEGVINPIPLAQSFNWNDTKQYSEKEVMSVLRFISLQKNVKPGLYTFANTGTIMSIFEVTFFSPHKPLAVLRCFMGSNKPQLYIYIPDGYKHDRQPGTIDKAILTLLELKKSGGVSVEEKSVNINILNINPAIVE